MVSQRTQRLAVRVAGTEPPEWIRELEVLLEQSPGLTGREAVAWLGINRDTITCYLTAYHRHDLAAQLRPNRSSHEWALLVETELDRDPDLTITTLAARTRRKPATIRRALLKAGRHDLLDRLRPRPRRAEWVALAQEAFRTDEQLKLWQFARTHRTTVGQISTLLRDAGQAELLDAFLLRGRRPHQEWAQRAERAMAADPTLHLHRFAAEHHRSLNSIRRALIKSGRQDLLQQSRSRPANKRGPYRRTNRKTAKTS